MAADGCPPERKSLEMGGQVWQGLQCHNVNVIMSFQYMLSSTIITGLRNNQDKEEA